MMNFSYSSIESGFSNLSVGRVEVSSGDVLERDKLLEAVNSFSLDLLRVRLPADYPSISNDLYKLGFPVFFSGGIRRFEVNCFTAPLGEIDQKISFESFIGSEIQEKEFFDILNDTWGQYPIGYYKTPVLNLFFDKATELKCVFEFYRKFNNVQNDRCFLWLLRVDGAVIGFLALTKFENYVDSSIAGIHSSLRNKGYFKYILRFIRDFCRKNNLTFFRCGARLENLFSQRAFEKEFMYSVGYDYVFHVISSQRLVKQLNQKNGIS
jgi:hypothetical protein